jgi:hypothetical protein
MIKSAVITSISMVAVTVISLTLAACTQAEPVGDTAVATPAAPTQDAATRAMPVVAGRPSRVFVMAGFGNNCEPLPAPSITITSPPKQGDVSFVVGQDTTIAASAQGTCTGQKAKGTGIYYTARSGATGSDQFSIAAQLASGETSTRSFEVKIAE